MGNNCPSISAGDCSVSVVMVPSFVGIEKPAGSRRLAVAVETPLDCLKGCDPHHRTSLPRSQPPARESNPRCDHQVGKLIVSLSRSSGTRRPVFRGGGL